MTKKWWVLISVACGTFMATLDASIVNIALPTLTSILGTDLARIKWVIIVYLLFLTLLLLPFGRLSDFYGRKKVFSIGYFIFILGSVACGLSENLPMILMARAIQGTGAALLSANGPAVLTSAFGIGERGKALGVMSVVVSLGLISGPSVGGLLISSMGWKSIFMVNIPFGILGLFLVQKYVENDSVVSNHFPFDWLGTFLQIIIFTCIIMVVDPPMISISGSLPFKIPRTALILSATLLLILFIKTEQHAQSPIFELSLLKNRQFLMANLANFFNFVSYSSVAVLMPFFLQGPLGYTPEKAGLIMTAIPLMVLLFGPVSGRFSDKFGTSGLSFFGAFIGAFSLFVMAGAFGLGIHDKSPIIWVIVGLGAMGVSSGLFQSPNNSAIMGSVQPIQLGIASAMLATIRNLGLVCGTGLATGLFGYRMQIANHYIDSLHFTFYIAGLIGMISMTISLYRGKVEEDGQKKGT